MSAGENPGESDDDDGKLRSLAERLRRLRLGHTLPRIFYNGSTLVLPCWIARGSVPKVKAFYVRAGNRALRIIRMPGSRIPASIPTYPRERHRMASSLPASTSYNSRFTKRIRSGHLGCCRGPCTQARQAGGVKYELIRHLSEVALGGMASANLQLSNIYMNPH